MNLVSKTKTDTGIKAHETAPMFNSYKQAKDTNMAIPTGENIKEAKDWVDYNEK